MGKQYIDKARLVAKITTGAALYDQHLVGKSFLYVFDKQAIEVVFRKKDFKHLTGVETKLPANQFYRNALRNKLRPNQISFSRRHPYNLCERKVNQLNRLSDFTTTDVLMLEGINTSSYKYKLGIADLSFTICLHDDTIPGTDGESYFFIPMSLRVEDSFDRSDGAHEVQFIFSKAIDAKMYDKVMYVDPQTSYMKLTGDVLKRLDANVQKNLQNRLKYKYFREGMTFLEKLHQPLDLSTPKDNTTKRNFRCDRE